jgi:hypothetical protein
MNRITALILAAGLALPAVAQDPKAEEGFAPIFNGKDLSGWVYGRKAGGENKAGAGFAVENGALFCTEKDGGYLFTEKEYADVVLRFDVRLAANANLGIALRAPLEGDPAYVGLEVKVLDDSGSEYRRLRPEQYHGSIYDVFAARRAPLKPAGEWNSEEVTVKARRVTVAVNGEILLDASLDDVKDDAIRRKHPGLKNARGRLGLLAHAGRVELRNLRVKEL